MLQYRWKEQRVRAPLKTSQQRMITQDVKGGTPMKTNKIVIIISAIAMIITAFAAYFCRDNAIVFDSCVLLLSLAFTSFYYSLLRRVYKW